MHLRNYLGYISEFEAEADIFVYSQYLQIFRIQTQIINLYLR